MTDEPPVPQRELSYGDDIRLRDPRLLALHALWHSKMPDGRLPARRDFDPVELKPALGAVFLTEYVPERDDFRYTLIGTEIVNRVGVDNTGRFVGDLFGNHGRMLYRTLRERRVPARLSGTVHWRDKQHVRFEMLVMPLADDGAMVDRTIGAMFFEMGNP